ncbi:unnamed protein product [Acanthosepion pharaonis]|uniref:Uncharacterized protein n=1 Tax=Acanthosepion pharaonis TaxID=158019 RepID=A0A812B0N6_ACAPH|nr:unnamed protein product [Sepia pharaonis]
MRSAEFANWSSGVLSAIGANICVIVVGNLSIHSSRKIDSAIECFPSRLLMKRRNCEGVLSSLVTWVKSSRSRSSSERPVRFNIASLSRSASALEKREGRRGRRWCSLFVLASIVLPYIIFLLAGINNEPTGDVYNEIMRTIILKKDRIYVLISFAAFLFCSYILFNIFTLWQASTCSNSFSIKFLQELCSLYKKEVVSGSLCHSICVSHTIRYQKCTNYRDGKVVIVADADDLPYPIILNSTNKRIKLIDTDCLLRDSIIKKELRNKSCHTDQECTFFDCKGWCRTKEKKCANERINTNLQVVCEYILQGKYFFVGLLKKAPLKLREKLSWLLRQCAYPVTYNNHSFVKYYKRKYFWELYRILQRSIGIGVHNPGEI